MLPKPCSSWSKGISDTWYAQSSLCYPKHSCFRPLFSFQPVCNEDGDILGLFDITKVFHEAVDKVERSSTAPEKLYNALAGVQSELVNPLANPDPEPPYTGTRLVFRIHPSSHGTTLNCTSRIRWRLSSNDKTSSRGRKSVEGGTATPLVHPRPPPADHTLVRNLHLHLTRCQT